MMYRSLYGVFLAFIQEGCLKPQGNFWFNGYGDEELRGLAAELEALGIATVTNVGSMIMMRVSETFITSGGCATEGGLCQQL